MKRNILSALFLAVVLSGPSFADGLILPVRPDFRVRGSWAVKYHRVDIKLRNQVADVSIDQAFVNTGPGILEVQYLFPLPPTAAIDGMTLLVDSKEFKGTILRAEEARRVYMDIVRTKRDPALLEYVSYGLFRTSAFPLPPGKEVRIAIHYADICRKDGDLVEVFYPLCTKIKSPVMTDLAVKFGDARTRMTYPDTMPDLYDGDQIILVGRYARPGRTNITVTGRVCHRRMRSCFEIRLRIHPISGSASESGSGSQTLSELKLSLPMHQDRPRFRTRSR
jgi:hypothetical protein